MKKIVCAITITLFFICISIDHLNANTLIKTDRWLEVDLYWFDRADIDKSVNEFWERNHSLFENLDGWKGVILNVGWLMDYVLEWRGELKSEINLPQNITTDPWFKVSGLLAGSTEDILEAHKERFDKAEKRIPVIYDKWTYNDLKKLANLLRKVAKVKYMIPDIRVGTFILGSNSIYDGEESSFSKKHKEIGNANNLRAKLAADKECYGAFTNGIPEGTPYVTFFGKQWGNLSQVVGLDAIVFRDHLLVNSAYTRNGPFGENGANSFGELQSVTQACSDFVRETKLSNPKALVIGYSSGASAVSDWRIHCFDLESVAKEGYLDAWIDQTWAGAWNEIGQRPNPLFWNLQYMGWTYQLTNVLVHAALLADTKVRHYVLTETYDAWEAWDIINGAPERLRWGIWAFTHASVKTPNGIKVPSGSYISWGNKGKNLLSQNEVDFLRKNINEAIGDASQIKQVYGPTLVYCKSAMKWQIENSPNVSIKEWIDDQMGSVLKWSIPILSITRMEYLDKVNSDMFVFQTPVHLSTEEKFLMMNHLKSRKPSVIIGSLVGGLDNDIAKIIGVSTKSSKIGEIAFVGTSNYKTTGIYEDLPNTFPIFQPFTFNETNAQNEVIYSVKKSPCLIYNSDKNILYWDAPELGTYIPDGGNFNRSAFGESMDQILGSPTPYTLVARKMNEMLKSNNCISVKSIDQYLPISILAWQTSDAKYKLLTADLESGIDHSGRKIRNISINIPVSWNEKGIIEYNDIWNANSFITTDYKLPILLKKGESNLYIF